MNYSAIKSHDIANGPGVRVSLFVSGCNIRCKGCFNYEAWDFNAGKPFTNDTIDKIIEMLKPDFISGLTVLGGEPLDYRNREEVKKLLQIVRSVYGDKKSIWLFTGYKYIHIDWSNDEAADNIFTYIDVLVDGPFIEEQKNLSLRFRGSENQRLIDMKKTAKAGHIVLLEDSANPMKERSLMHLDKIIEEEKNAAGH